MLKLSKIKKSYVTENQSVEALRGVDLEFRKSEFVSILGPSGCGKTTLLNIIGGLDQYTDGDLLIKGRSTKGYSDKEWDAYRNHSVGFVFQNYNLIPHQTVLANVEIALTLSGVSKRERRRRAEDALKRVGLGDQMYKKPNQMSGGQMQRVAIARAIVNDPEILLADEPTGALDTETSIQVMEILKEISSDRLVIMVTHNPELAEKYSTRIIKLLDGVIVGDTSPYTSENSKVDYVLKKNKSMSFFTALSLSINNLLTKKGRTIITCFAGSIGIIGIALILSVSNGVNIFIDKVQEDTLSKYPLSIQEEQVDMSLMLEAMSSTENNLPERELDKVYASDMMFKMVNLMTSVPTSKNNITDFKKYIETNADFNKHSSAIKYTYNVPMNFYVKNSEGEIVKVNSETVITDMYEAMGVSVGGGSASSAMVESYSSFVNVWEEMLSGEDGELINPMLKEQYDLVHGKWPESSNEVVLVLSENNELSDFVLYALGLKSSSELAELMEAAMKGEKLEYEEQSWTYEELCNMTLKMILASDAFQKQSDGTYIDLLATQNGLSMLFDLKDKYTEIKISGIIRPNENALFSMVGGSIGYTSALTEYIINKTAESEIVKSQLENPEIDIFTGLKFNNPNNKLDKNAKVEEVKNYFSAIGVKRKAELFVKMASAPSEEYVVTELNAILSSLTIDQIIEQMVNDYAAQAGTTDFDSVRAYIENLPEEQLLATFSEQARVGIIAKYSEAMAKQFEGIPEEELSARFDELEFTDEQYESFYSLYLPSSASSYEENIKKLGYVDIDSPSGITIYAASFNDKNVINDLIDEYNASVSEENQIKMTDYVALLMSSVSTVINAISYVLIAFVGISLVVSSIMIAVITNISVLERTKEIGILRAVGASKADVGHIFTAETFIIGLMSGVLGILVTLILIIPINIILRYFTDIAYLNAALPVGGAIILILLSTLLTVIAGIIPSRAASKKDPVVALRSE